MIKTLLRRVVQFLDYKRNTTGQRTTPFPFPTTKSHSACSYTNTLVNNYLTESHLVLVLAKHGTRGRHINYHPAQPSGNESLTNNFEGEK